MPWDPLNEDHQTYYADLDLNAADQFVTQVPMRDTYGASASFSWRSMTGVCPASLSAAPDVDDKMWYPGCTAVKDYWGWNTNGKTYGETRYQCTNRAIDRKQNVICMQELQLKYDPTTQQRSHVVEDRGHWGPNVGPGMLATINGDQMTFRVPFYNQTKVMSLV